MSWAVEVAAVAGYPAWALGPGERERERERERAIRDTLLVNTSQVEARKHTRL